MSTITRQPRVSPATPRETATVPAEERGVMRDVSYGLYDCLSSSLSEHASIRVAYDGKDVEIMVVGPIHDRLKESAGLFIHEVSVGLGIDYRAQGSTTWKRAALERGLEADQCYYFDPAKLAAGDAAVSCKSNDVADYPNPDLAVEIDISPSKIDRPGIYAALEVTEVWRFRDETVSIEQFGPDGAYTTAAASRFLHVRPDEVMRWIADGQAGNPGDWARRLREWIQTELKARVDSSAPDKPRKGKGGKK
jgi:Uma2 family endonuclease